MRCIYCESKLEPSSDDRTMIISEYAIIRWTKCSCGEDNVVKYHRMDHYFGPFAD